MPCYQRLWDMEGGDNGEGNAFVGARHWEQMAREAAREADEEEARALQAEEDARAGQMLNAAELDADEAELLAEVARDDERQREWEGIREGMNRARAGMNLMVMVMPMDGVNPGDNAAPPPPPPAPAQPARRGRGRGNPFRPPAANGQGAAVRAHERGGRGRGRANLGNGAVRRNAPAPEQEHAREEGELQRFVELALNDEEEGWDSDELGEEEEFVIR